MYGQFCFMIWHEPNGVFVYLLLYSWGHAVVVVVVVIVNNNIRYEMKSWKIKTVRKTIIINCLFFRFFVLCLMVVIFFFRFFCCLAFYSHLTFLIIILRLYDRSIGRGCLNNEIFFLFRCCCCCSELLCSFYFWPTERGCFV